MTPWATLFLIVGRTLISAESVLRHQDASISPTARDPLPRIFLDSKVLQVDEPRESEKEIINLSCLPLEDWNEAQSPTSTDSIGNTTLSMLDTWHPLKIEYHEFVTRKTLQPDRLLIVTHAAFANPVLVKLASTASEIPSLQREASIYRLLEGSGATPDFFGHVTDGESMIGFVTEYISEVPTIRLTNMRGCLNALESLHGRGIAHGDAHDGNCLIRDDGSAVLIDFELSVETSDREEFERDLDIMARCIHEIERLL